MVITKGFVCPECAHTGYCEEEGHPIAMRFAKVNGFRKEKVAPWAQRYRHAASVVVSDWLSSLEDITAGSVMTFASLLESSGSSGSSGNSGAS